MTKLSPRVCHFQAGSLVLALTLSLQYSAGGGGATVTPILEETDCDRTSCITGGKMQSSITPDGMLTRDADSY